MKNSSNGMVIFLTGVLTMLLLFSASPGFCETSKKVAVCPLQMNAAQDLSFLQKGLFSMLSSRLSDPGKVDILDRETIDKALLNAQSSPSTKGALNESKAALIGKDLGVDYILFGNVTMFGDSVSLDTTMVDVTGATPALTFSRQAEQPGAVITELDKIATEINFKTFNRKTEEFIPQAQYAQAPQRQRGGDSYSSPLVNHRVLLATSGEIIGLSLGDVDGDKKNEVAIVYPHAIEILEDNMNGQLVPVKKIEDGRHMDIVGVDVADINHNGTAEIFISRVHRESGYVRSYVLEYDGSTYKNISGMLPWYLRVVKTDDKHHTLYAQVSGRQGPYKAKSVFEVIWENNAYVPGENLKVPDGFTVMSLSAKTDIGQAGAGQLFTNKTGQLTVFNENGVVEWISEKGYGGSKVYYEYQETDMNIRDLADGRGEYFQPRSLVLDGEAERGKVALAIKNVDAADNLFGQIRRFKSGSIEMLKWSEMGLSPNHAPKSIPGQVTDIAMGNFDNTSEKTILVAFIKKSNNFDADKSKSMIVAYDVE